MAIIQQMLLTGNIEAKIFTWAENYDTHVWGGRVDVDDDENIYFASAGADNAFVSKLDKAGNLLWSRGINDSRDSNSWWGVAVNNSNGDVYCVGTTYGNIPSGYGLQLQCLLAKYNSSGVRQWAKIIGDVATYISNWNHVYSEQENLNGRIASCDNNGIHFAMFKEHACGAGFIDIYQGALVRIDANGNKQLETQISHYTSVPDGGVPTHCSYTQKTDRSTTWNDAVKSRTGNNYYMSGSDILPSRHFESTHYTDRRCILAKCNSSGSLTWLRRFRYRTGNPASGSGSRGSFGQMSLDSSDNIYMVGGHIQQGHSPQTRNSCIFKINSSGSLQWIRRYNSTTTGLSESDYLSSIVVDPDDDNAIFIVGNIKQYGTYAWGTDQTVCHITKLDSSGNKQWDRLISGFNFTSSQLLIKKGVIYMGGYSNTWGSTQLGGSDHGNGLRSDAMLIKIPVSGSCTGSFSVRNGLNNGNYDIHILDLGNSLNMSWSTPSYAYYDSSISLNTHAGNTAYGNATNYDGGTFGDDNANINTSTITMGHYS